MDLWTSSKRGVITWETRSKTLESRLTDFAWRWDIHEGGYSNTKNENGWPRPTPKKLWTDKVLLNLIVRTPTAFYLSNIATTLPTRWLNKDTYLAICWTTITSSQYTFTAYAIKHCQKHSGLSALFAWVIQPFIHITIRNFFSNQNWSWGTTGGDQ